jgi:hypothetical protein
MMEHEAPGTGQIPPAAIVNSDLPDSSIRYGYPWLRDFIRRGTGLDLDESQVQSVARMADRKLIDLVDVAAEAATANGRATILPHDLPLTKGLRRVIEDVALLSHEIDLKPILVFLAGSGIRSRIDEATQGDMPRLLAALLVLSGRIVAVIEPANLSPVERLELVSRSTKDRPSNWELERAGRILDLTL